MLSLATADLTGRTIGRYEIEAFIRGGSQGRVYRGRDERLRRDVAIKALHTDHEMAGRTPGALQAEAQALSALTHVNVVSVYDFFTDAGRDYIVMELVSGPTLEDMLLSGPLPMPEVVRLGSQLARGLGAIHAARIAHCDIKPSNLMLAPSGVLKIVDFGVARRLAPGALGRHHASKPTPVIGTFPYMAPEVFRGEGADEQSDIFSVGAVLYEMATGWPAFPQHALPELKDAITSGRFTIPSLINAIVPAAFDRVVLKALQRAAVDRHRTALDLAEAIEDVAVTYRAHRRQLSRSTRVRPRKLDTTVALPC